MCRATGLTVASSARSARADNQDTGIRVALLRRGDPDLPAARWDQLAWECALPNPFFERWALLPALDAFAPGDSVRLACIYEADRLIGLLPVVHSGDYYGYPVPHYRTWLHANAFCGAPLVLQGREVAFWEALLDWADAASASALFLHLAGLPEDGPLYAALARAADRHNRPSAVVMREERALLSSDLAPAAYFDQSMSGKKRKELRRRARRLGEEGTIHFSRETDERSIAQWSGQFLALEKKGWKGDEGSALASAAETERFFREAMENAAGLGRLERLTLMLDGAPIAMLANLVAAPGVFSFKTAYDEAYARFSPGVLLQRENLDLLERRDIEWCDSCASEGHPMIERIWREKRTILRVSVGLGGVLRRQVARAFLAAETRQFPHKLETGSRSAALERRS